MSSSLSRNPHKIVSIRHRWEFGRTYKHGRKVWNHAFVVYVLSTATEGVDDIPQWRYGLTATKKIGDSVRRNRGKRLVRESLRLSAALIRDGRDIVVVIRQRALVLRCQEAQTLLLDLLARGGALKRRASSPTKRADFASDCFPRPPHILSDAQAASTHGGNR